MINIGKIQKLTLKGEDKSGFHLEDDEGNRVFMPPGMAPRSPSIGEKIDVFVYTDTTGSIIASSILPYAEVGDYAYLRVNDMTDFGAFLDWGIEKDLLVPGNCQKREMFIHESHLVRICLEEDTGRIYGTSKLGDFVAPDLVAVSDGDKIAMLPYQKTDLGYKVLVNKKFLGLIYHNEIFSKVTLGEEISGVVKKVRVDGLIDAALQAQGAKNTKDSKKIIIDALEQNDNFLPLHDKSDPWDIKTELGMSKQAFKKAVGGLYKDKIIEFTGDGIKLIK